MSYLCDNGLEQGQRCRARPAPGYNPLGLCTECLAAYRRVLPRATAPEDEGPHLVLNHGATSALAGAERPSPWAGVLGRVLFYDAARGRKVRLEQPPGGVPVLGRDFWVGPDAGAGAPQASPAAG